MTQRDMAIYLDITPVTLRNWRKKKPNLYRIVLMGFKADEIIEKSEKNIEELKELKEKLEGKK